MRVKISSFHSLLHESTEFENSNAEFLKSIEKKIGVKFEISDLDDYDCDLKLIFIESGGSEGKFLENFKKLKEPYYFLTSGTNNSLAASLEILTYLNNKNKKCEVLHGEISYISQRIKDLALINSIKNKLSQTRLGILGNPSDWLISSIPNYSLVKEKFGISLINVPINEVNKLAKKERKINPGITIKFNKKEKDKAVNIYGALKSIVEKKKLDGITIRCFDLLTSLKSTSCLALGLLNKNGITGCCEGDIMAMITMKIAELVSGKSSFQANPSQINVKKNEIVLAHCTVPFNMLESYKFMTHFESNSGLAIKGELFKRDVTVFRISSDLKRYFVSEGKILENLDNPNLCRTQIKVKLREPVSSLLESPCGNHHIVFYGKYKRQIDLVMKEFLK